MATNTTTVIGNLLDVMKFKLPDGSPITRVVNTMNEIDHLTKDLPALPANNGLTQHGLRLISLPTGYLVDVGGSWKSSKADFEPYVEGLMSIRSTFQASADTYKTESESIGRAQLQANLDAHVMALNQGTTHIMLNGASTPNQSAILGLMQRPPYTTYDGAFCFDGGGSNSSTDLTSIWMMKPGIDTVHAMYNPNHPTLGVEQEDMGKVHIPGLGTSSDEHRWDIMVEFLITKGLCIRDMTAVKRICNIACGAADYPGEDIINIIIEASIVNATKNPGMGAQLGNAEPDIMNTWMAYCSERMYARLVQAANNKLMVYKSDENIYRTKLPMIGDNIIIRRMDALNHAIGSGETYIAAA